MISANPRGVYWTLLCVVTLAGVAIADEREFPDAFEVCTSCHSYERDEPALVGPPLWGVVGRRIASVEGYDYSPAMKAITGTWDRATLDRFLTNTKAFVPGAKMEMGGVRSAADRAKVIDFLERLRPGEKDEANDDD
jgi:cytochrome c